MKKLNKVFFTLIILLACITTFISCNTVPAGNYVDPLNLLDNKSGFYLAVPKNADVQLIQRIISKYVPGLAEKDIKLICDKTSKIYCGITRSRHGTEIQSAVDGNIPLKLIPKFLTKKNGWKLRDFVSEETLTPHVIYGVNGMELSFPASNIACIGRDIDFMLNKHDVLAYTPIDVDNLPGINNDYHSELPKEVFDFLSGADDEIRFYANQPKSFLTTLIGANLDLKLIDVQGAFTVDPSYPDQYLLDIYFNFKSNKFLKAGKSLLNLSFGLSSSQTEMVGTTGLIVKDIELKKEQLYKILVL